MKHSNNEFNYKIGAIFVNGSNLKNTHAHFNRPLPSHPYHIVDQSP